MDEVRPLNEEIYGIDSPARLTSVDSFDNARGAVEEGDETRTFTGQYSILELK